MQRDHEDPNTCWPEKFDQNYQHTCWRIITIIMLLLQSSEGAKLSTHVH